MSHKTITVVNAIVICIALSLSASVYGDEFARSSQSLSTAQCDSLMRKPKEHCVLSLQSAEQLALNYDPRLRKAAAIIASSVAGSEAVGRLPDPKIKFAAMNLPVDSFDLDQEAMTNLLVGVQQSFPAGSTLELEKSTAQLKIQVRENETAIVRKNVLRELRNAWLATWAGQANGVLVAEQRRVLESLLPIVKGAYRAGRSRQSDVSQIQLRLAQLDEKQYQFLGDRDNGLADLSRWGIQSVIRLPVHLPAELISVPDGEINIHPELGNAASMAEVSRYEIDLAEQAYKPTWGVEASYGWRDQRADLLTVAVSLSLPIFAEKSLDAGLASRQKAYQAARESMQNVRLQLETEKQRIGSQLNSLNHRIDSYESEILPELHTLQTLTRSEYRSGQVDFSKTLESDEALIKAQRLLLNLQIEKAENIIALRYLLEEMQS